MPTWTRKPLPWTLVSTFPKLKRKGKDLCLETLPQLRERDRRAMGRPPCCDKIGVKKGPWTPEEDIILVSYIQEHGPGNWRAVPTSTGLIFLLFLFGIIFLFAFPSFNLQASKLFPWVSSSGLVVFLFLLFWFGLVGLSLKLCI